MGARFSHRASAANDGDATDVNKAASGPVELQTARIEFQSQIKKVLMKKSPSAGHLRLDIKGQIEKYPFWISKLDLRKGTENNRGIEYSMIEADKMVVPCPPKLPNNLHCHLNKTIRLALKHKKSSISDVKQENYPEHDVILKCVTKLLLRVSLVEDGSQPSQLKFQIYERHRNFKTGRRPMHMREMRVERVMFDRYNNMAIVGNEFALIIYKMETEQEHATDSPLQITGVYIRQLDTCPSALLTFNCTDTGSVDEMLTPANVSHVHEYSKRILSKSSSIPFRVKLSPSKGYKTKAKRTCS